MPTNTARGRRLYVLWAAALALLLALGLVCWLVVVPYLQVRSELQRLRTDDTGAYDVLERLGGPREAARKLELYLKMPSSLSEDSECALFLLVRCCKEPRAADALISAALHRDPDKRAPATLALVNLGEKGLPTLLNALNDPNFKVRLEALDALRLLAGGKTVRVPVHPLLKVLEDPDPTVRWEALNAVGAIGPEARPALGHVLKAMQDTTKANDAYYCYMILGMPGMRVGEVRMAAVEALGKLNAPEAIGPMIGALSDPDADMRACAAKSFGDVRLEVPQAGRALLAALNDGSPSVRCYAAVSLATIRPRPEGTVAVLTKLLGDSEPGVQVGAAYALGIVGSDARDALPRLKAIAARGNKHLAPAAADAMKKITASRGKRP